ncbi:MAG TPA: DUF1566 domain-containing protein [Burkholderiaceae bacterium]|nr:DUF1566 domain-containing protein [Burkholderiaceae bacterium]
MVRPLWHSLLGFVLMSVGMAVLDGAHAQTGLLNDTGQTVCYDATNAAVACDAATAGNTGTRPHQDGRYGRDAAQAAGMLPAKTGGGAAGFDFSCVLWDGTMVHSPTCTSTLTANTTDTASATPATDWACTQDNVTGLLWSLQTRSATWNAAVAASFPNAGHNTVHRCGHSTGWRLPTRRELLGIVHWGQVGPSIDAAYFPATPRNWHWSSDPAADNALFAWMVYFEDGTPIEYYKTTPYFVRLVRSGP